MLHCRTFVVVTIQFLLQQRAIASVELFHSYASPAELSSMCARVVKAHECIVLKRRAATPSLTNPLRNRQSVAVDTPAEEDCVSRLCSGQDPAAAAALPRRSPRTDRRSAHSTSRLRRPSPEGSAAVNRNRRPSASRSRSCSICNTSASALIGTCYAHSSFSRFPHHLNGNLPHRSLRVHFAYRAPQTRALLLDVARASADVTRVADAASPDSPAITIVVRVTASSAFGALPDRWTGVQCMFISRPAVLAGVLRANVIEVADLAAAQAPSDGFWISEEEVRGLHFAVFSVEVSHPGMAVIGRCGSWFRVVIDTGGDGRRDFADGDVVSVRYQAHLSLIPLRNWLRLWSIRHCSSGTIPPVEQVLRNFVVRHFGLTESGEDVH